MRASIVVDPTGFRLPEDQRRIIRWTIYVAFAALSVGIVNGLGQALNYAGIDILKYFPGMRTYYQGLTVHGVFNAIYLEGDNVGRSMLYGRGAGSLPTASAVMGDVLAITEDLRRGKPAGADVFQGLLHVGGKAPDLRRARVLDRGGGLQQHRVAHLGDA